MIRWSDSGSNSLHANDDEVGFLGWVFSDSEGGFAAVGPDARDVSATTGTYETEAAAKAALERHAHDTLIPELKGDQPGENEMAKDPGITKTLSAEERVKRMKKLVVVDRKINKQVAERAEQRAALNGDLKTLREEQRTLLETIEPGDEAQLKKLVTVDRKINRKTAEKAELMSELNSDLKGLRDEQRTLLDTVQTGKEVQHTQTEAFGEDDHTPAPRGTGKSKTKKKAKKAKKTSDVTNLAAERSKRGKK